jgi:hypothetical protein
MRIITMCRQYVECPHGTSRISVPCISSTGYRLKVLGPVKMGQSRMDGCSPWNHIISAGCTKLMDDA